MKHYDIKCIIYIIWSIPKHLINRYDIFIVRIQHVLSREPLAPQVRTKTGGLCGGFTPIQFVTVINIENKKIKNCSIKTRTGL